MVGSSSTNGIRGFAGADVRRSRSRMAYSTSYSCLRPQDNATVIGTVPSLNTSPSTDGRPRGVLGEGHANASLGIAHH